MKRLGVLTFVAAMLLLSAPVRAQMEEKMGPGAMESKGSGEMMGMMGQMMERMMEGMMRGMEGMMGRMMGESYGGDTMGCPKGMHGMGYGHGHSTMAYRDGSIAKALKERLNLSDEQADKVRKLERTYKKEAVRLHSGIRIAEIDLKALLEEDPIDMEKVEKKVREIEGNRSELRLARIRFFKGLLAILTPGQKKRFKESCL